MELCKTSAAQCKSIMEIGKANQFENLLEQSKRDLMNLQSARNHGYAPPAYHYEERQIPTFNINPEVEPDQCEVDCIVTFNLLSFYETVEFNRFNTY